MTRATAAKTPTSRDQERCGLLVTNREAMDGGALALNDEQLRLDLDSNRGRIALVTGGVTGIGRAVALALAEAGYTVVACDRDKERGAGLPAQLHAQLEARRRAQPQAQPPTTTGQVQFKPCDVSSARQVARLVKEVLAEYGRLDVVVNNAGIIRRRTGEKISLTDWDAVFKVNARGAFLVCREVAPILKRQRSGRIINISSVAAKLGDITSAPGYGPAKAALDALTKTFARELAPYGVTVNSVAPHAIETEMSAQWSDEKRRAVVAAIPLGRMGKPEEVAAAVVFLASPGAAFITGAVIDVNGGFVMG